MSEIRNEPANMARARRRHARTAALAGAGFALGLVAAIAGAGRPPEESSPVPYEKRTGILGGFVNFLRDFGGEFISAVLIGWFVELLFALSAQGHVNFAAWADFLAWLSDVFRTFSVIWFASGAAFFVGTITGFVFGFPKTRSAGSSPTGLGGYLDNTNLEEVSDWLTKIIVGLGLIEFQKIVAFIGELGNTVGQAAGGQSGATMIAVASMLYGFICGFLYYYVWARLRLYEEFRRRTIPLTRFRDRP